MYDEVKRVLIYRLGSLGDTVVALPALHLVARSFPNAERRILTNYPVNVKAPAAAAVLGESGLVHGYFRYAVGMRSPLELLRLWWALARWRPQVLIYTGAARGIKSARRDAWFFRVCGIWRQIGVPLTQKMQANLPEPDGALEPEVERLVRNLSDLGHGAVGEPSSWDLRLTAPERLVADEALLPATGRPLLAVSVGTKVQAKDWGGGELEGAADGAGKAISTLRSGPFRGPRRERNESIRRGGLARRRRAGQSCHQPVWTAHTARECGLPGLVQSFPGP